jgi:hypothetical protein
MSSRCGGEASHEGVGLLPCSSITRMTSSASNIDAKHSLLARTYPYGHLVFRASCRYSPLLILSAAGAASSPTAGPNDNNPASMSCFLCFQARFESRTDLGASQLTINGGMSTRRSIEGYHHNELSVYHQSSSSFWYDFVCPLVTISSLTGLVQHS